MTALWPPDFGRHHIAASLDGFITTPDVEMEWLAPFGMTDEDYGYAAFYTFVEAVLLRSRTYEPLLILIGHRFSLESSYPRHYSFSYKYTPIKGQANAGIRLHYAT